MAKIFKGERTFLHPVFGRLETLTYKMLKVNGLVDANTSQRWLEIYGEARVNVLKVNLALDKPG